MYSLVFLDHYQTPRNQGRLARPSGEGLAGSLEVGQYVRIQVRLEDERIAEARFQTYGCAPAIACSSYLTEWATGRTPAEVLHMTPNMVERALGGLPASRRFCAHLAVEALRKAITQAGRS